LFVALFVVGLVDSILSGMWLSRTRRKAVVAANPYYHPPVPVSATGPVEPGDEGVRLERLKTLTALRDSGALTPEEFEAEKRRILKGE
jgi:putative oligomerization/nucleic acid binding protein